MSCACTYAYAYDMHMHMYMCYVWCGHVLHVYVCMCYVWCGVELPAGCQRMHPAARESSSAELEWLEWLPTKTTSHVWCERLPCAYI